MPNRDTDSNRFKGLALADLYEACQVRASTLLGANNVRNTQERTNLSKDTAHLLLAVSPALASGEQVPGTAAKSIAQGTEDFMPAFLTEHEMALRQVRYRTLVVASDLAYGGAAETWRRDGVIDNQRVYDLAMDTEEGLGIVLAHLERVYSERVYSGKGR